MAAYLTAEPGGQVVRGMLLDAEAVCYAHSINLCEVYYDTLRGLGTQGAQQAVATLMADGVIERRDLSRPFWQTVGRLKSRGRISLADCFGIALAQKLGGEVVTSDHHEFDPLIPLGIVPVRFIR